MTDLYQLKKALVDQKFGLANEITRGILYQESGLESGSLEPEVMYAMDDEIFSTVDHLWTKNTDGYFGFTKQKKILASHGYDRLVESTGWAVRKSLYSSDDFSLGDNKAILPYLGSIKFWDKPSILIPSSNYPHHIHKHGYHYHPPHRHDHNGGGGAWVAAPLLAAVPWVVGAAAVGGVAWGVWWLATKEERERKEREEQAQLEKQRKQEEAQDYKLVKRRIEALLSLI